MEDHTFALPVGIHGQKCPQSEQELDPHCSLCLALQKRVSNLWKGNEIHMEKMKKKLLILKTSNKLNILLKYILASKIMECFSSLYQRLNPKCKSCNISEGKGHKGLKVIKGICVNVSLGEKESKQLNRNFS